MYNHQPPHWHILGAGAIGCLWGSELAHAGAVVTLLLKPSHQQDWPGYIERLDQQQAPMCKVPVQAELLSANTPIENLLITTKAYDVVPAIEQLSHRLDTIKNLVILVNGLGAQEDAVTAVKKRLPTSTKNSCRFWAATTTEGAWCPQRFSVIHAGVGKTLLGSLSSTQNKNAALTSPFDELTFPNLEYEATHAIQTKLWQKFAINCAINPLTAIHRVNNGQLVTQPNLHQTMADICKEVEQVAQALNISLFDPMFTPPLIKHATKVAQATKANYSSMYQDVTHQRRSEIDYITGYLVNQAKALDIETPISASLAASIQQLSR